MAGKVYTQGTFTDFINKQSQFGNFIPGTTSKAPVWAD